MADRDRETSQILVTVALVVAVVLFVAAGAAALWPLIGGRS